MRSVIHFEITTDAPAATSEFLSAAFGWTSGPAGDPDGYQQLDTGAGSGIDGGIAGRTYQFQPVILWLLVPDLRSAMDAVIAAGGSVLGEPTELGTLGRFVRIADPSGTLFGLREARPVSEAAFGLPVAEG